MSLTVLDSTACRLGEGPTFDQATNTAWWFDIEGKTLFEKPLDAEHATAHTLPLMASALATVDAERQLLVTENGLYLRQTKTGELSLHTPLEEDNPLTRSNDSRVHPCGAFWIGTMGKKAEPGAGAIYHFLRGKITRMFSDITVSNAICFSADGTIGHYADSVTGQIMRVELDSDTGLPVGEPSVFVDKRDDKEGVPDGAVVDGDGLLWSARWGGYCLTAFDASGALVETVPLPVEQVTCPAFAGTDRLFVTSATTGLSDDDLVKQPLAGQTLLLDRQVRARPEPHVIL